MKQKKFKMPTVCMLVFLPLAPLVAQTNLAVTGSMNPNFETGLTPWGGSGFHNASIDTVNPGEGNQSAKLAASSTTSYNTLVSSMRSIPVASGKSYMLSVLTRQNLSGGSASFALNELNASQVSTHYLWKTTTSSSAWHSESLILTPRTDTQYLRIYFLVDSTATSGASWWDNCRLIELGSSSMTAATTNPFPAGDLTNLAIDIAPLPATTFVWSGTVLSPSALVPSANIGTLLVGGELSWQVQKIVTPPATPPAPILQNSMVISGTGLCAWTVDLRSASPALTAGNYLLSITATSRDQTILRNVTKAFSVQ